MVRERSFFTQNILPVAGAMLCGAMMAVPAYADDPLQPIKSTIQRDRQNACPNSGILSYDRRLETLAQNYARSEKMEDLSPAPPGYNSLAPYLGAGDPQAQAINRAYTNGAGPKIGTCGEFAYGVGFKRWDNRSVDVVTIVFGELAPPLRPARIRLTPGNGSFFIAGSGFSPNSTVKILYNYYPNGGGVTGNYGGPNMTRVDSGGNFDNIVKVSTLNSHGRLEVVADDGGLSTTKSISF